jgi:hypothetical protein
MTGASVLRLDPRGELVAAVAARLLERLDALAEGMIAAYREVPEYAALGEEEMRGQVLPVSRRIVEEFLRPVAELRQPDARLVTEIPAMGTKRLEMGIPLEPMLHVYRIAGRVVWQELCAVCDAGETAVLADLGALWMDYMDRAASIAASAYLDASNERTRRDGARRQALRDAVLAADDAAGLAAVAIRFSTVLAAEYVPLCTDAAEAPAVDDLAADLPAGTLAGLRGGRALVLVPAPVPAGAVDAVVARVAGGCVAVGDRARPGPELVAAVGDAETLLACAQRAGRAGVVGHGDLLLERAAVADPQVAARLASVLDGVRARDHDGLLVDTLRTYLASGSVPATARAEHVHPNTVLYRLGRVRELAGLDPRVPADAATLLLALHVPGGST